MDKVDIYFYQMKQPPVSENTKKIKHRINYTKGLMIST